MDEKKKKPEEEDISEKPKDVTEAPGEEKDVQEVQPEGDSPEEKDTDKSGSDEDGEGAPGKDTPEASQHYGSIQKTDGMASQFGYTETYAVLNENKLTVLMGRFAENVKY